MTPLSVLLVDADPNGLETLTYGFEREGASVNATSDLTAAPKLVGAAAPQLVVVNLREPEIPAGIGVIRLMRTGSYAVPHVAVLALGPSDQQPPARAVGANGFLTTPTFLRDVVSAGKLALLGRRQSGQDAPLTQARLSDYHGLYYLLRAMASTGHSAVVRLERGNRRAELRISEGRLMSATVGSLQSLPALHHVLLWEEASLSLKLGPVPKRSQLNLTSQEVLDESERFLRDFAHAVRDLGPSTTRFAPANEGAAAMQGLQQSQVAPLLRLCDGHRGLAEVISESPFRIFDTVRMIKRLRDGGTLVARSDAPAPLEAPGHNGVQTSMLGEWAMVPDLRGVVGNRRAPSRPVRPLAQAPARAPTPAHAIAPLAAHASAPIPLLHRKGSGAAGEILPVPTSEPARTDLGMEPTVQVKLDAHGMPLSESVHGQATPLAPVTPPPVTVVQPRPTPIQLRTRADHMDRARLENTPPPVRRSPSGPRPTLERPATGPRPTLDRPPSGPRPTLERPPSGPRPTWEHAPPPRGKPATGQHHAQLKPVTGQHHVGNAFDEVEADFFAREADLYKREAVETFDDLDHPLGSPKSGKPRSRKR
jgi:CheY-like chemotaxis protein